ncbi:hypothetical protein Q5P01_016933 [Channa striata]|uniref:Nucleobindin-1 n=1 Tax=Channa striata TaxID=64152 RepID=A0AA88SAY3_CHASR|nr:hypothetical protein Q5P01_016933 [Channa striata]
MDRGVSVSLWCEEVEDEQRQDPGQTEAPVQGHIRGSSQLRAAWDPTVSGHRVIQRLLHVEERYMPSMLYVTLIQRDPERRDELTKWALEVCCECGCDEPVFPLSVSLLDRFLSASLSLPVSPYCLAAGCILIASKLTECDNVTADTLCAAAEYSFQPCNLREMERIILATLRWDTAAVTPQDFLPHFLASVEQRGAADSDECEEQRLSTLRRHSDTLAAMCACDSRFLGAPPSLVAAASLNCALRGLANKGPSQLALMSEALAELCQTDLAVLQCYSEMIEYALRQRLRSGHQQGPMEKEETLKTYLRRMTLTPGWLLLLSISAGVWSVPIDRNGGNQAVQEEVQEESMDTGLYYDRYLREVIEVLETDPHFREKLQTANTEDIKNGRLSKELDLVSHHVRTRLDELKRQEVSRLRMLLKAKLDSKNTQSLQMDHASLLKQFEHLDPHNQNTFEAKDLELLISTATKDLENYDAERHEEFKRYEMLKEHERREYLKSLDQEKREREEKRMQELKEKHRQHPKVNAPGSVAQLREVWEETDGLDPQEFNPKTFFKLHDTNEDGVLDEQELEALFTKELEKVYDPKNEEDDMMEMEEERLRMREHVMKNVDTNKDRLVSLEEFLKSTEKKEFSNPKEWETLDTKPVYSEEELRRFEAELKDKEEELKRRAETLRQEQELLKERGKALEAQRREYQQAVMEMSQRQKELQAADGQPPAGPNGELQFQPETHKPEDKEAKAPAQLEAEAQNNLPAEPPQNLPSHT